MNESWGRSIEQVLLIAAENKVRVLGVISPDNNSGVTTLCRNLAEASQGAGWRTLLADFSQSAEAENDDHWSPGDGPPRIIQSNRFPYDLIRIRATAEMRSKFNNVGALQQAFGDDLKQYDRIIVDLPAVLESGSDAPNPIAAARACDTVIMVCMAARITKNRLKTAVAALDAISVRLGGLILNDRYNPTLGAQLAASAMKLPLWPRRLSSWIAAKAKASDTLNSPL